MSTINVRIDVDEFLLEVYQKSLDRGVISYEEGTATPRDDVYVVPIAIGGDFASIEAGDESMFAIIFCCTKGRWPRTPILCRPENGLLTINPVVIVEDEGSAKETAMMFEQDHYYKATGSDIEKRYV